MYPWVVFTGLFSVLRGCCGFVFYDASAGRPRVRSGGSSEPARGLLNIALPRVAPISLRDARKGFMVPDVRTGTRSDPQRRVAAGHV